MARSWGVPPSKVRQDTKLTRWVERQIAYIADRFGLDLPRLEVIECPGGQRFDGRRRVMAVGGFPWEPISIVAVADDVLNDYTPTALHYVVRHEVAHIIDRQRRGTSDETSYEFRRLCDRLNAPISGSVDDSDDMTGLERAHMYAKSAPMEVQEYASKGL